MDQAMKSSNASDVLFTAEADALAKLNELSSRLWTMQSLREGLEEMLAATIGLLGAHMGNVQIRDAGRGVLTIAAQRGFEQDFLDFFREVSTEDDSACGRALRSGERIVIEDVETDVAYTPMRPVARAAGYRAVQSTPLIGRNGVRLGMLSTHFATPHRPTELELRGLDLYARQAADYIERCQTDQALRDSEQRFRSFADTAPATLWVTNADASANFLSRGWYDYTGQSEAEAMGKDGFGWLSAVHPDDRERAGRIFLEANQKHEPFSVDYRLRRSDGEYRWAIDAGRPRFGSAGEFLGYIGSVIDVHDRKQSEQALREADRRFRTMADTAPVLIWETDPRGAVFVNQHYLEFFGVDFDAVRAMGWAEFLHPDDATAYIEVYREAFERRQPYAHECRFRRADGQYRWLLTTGGPLGVDHFVGYCADITENKRSEELLRQKEERFRSLVSIVADVPWTTNGAGEFVEPQDAYAKYTGKSWEELRGSGWINCIHPDDQPGLMDAWQRAVAAMTIYNATCREWHGPTQQWRHVIARGTPVLDGHGSVREWVGTLIDIHEQRMADQALRDSEARLKRELDDSELLRKASVAMTNRGDAALLYERILDAAVTIMRSDYASVQMLYPDRGPAGQLRLLGSRGFSPEAAAFWEWVRADAGSTCGMALRIGRRVIVPDVETCTEMAGTDDRATYLQAGIRAVQSTPLISRSGVLVGMLSTHWNKPHEPTERELLLFDILARQATHLIEQTNAMEALRASKEQLLEADRRKDEFLAVLAHELRNPLAPIRTGLEIIRLAGNTAASVERERKTMERQVGHMVRLIDDLLDVSRITSGKIQLQRRPTPLADVVSNAIEANRAAIDAARIYLRVDLPEQPCLLNVDPTRMSQVLANLLNNAVKCTQPGGHIDVSAQCTMPATNDTAGEVGLTVADDGIGISEEMLQRVFDLFTQGPQAKGGRTQPGLGIGLALARRLVEMHGGRIDATSKGLDQGSTFSVHLPITPGLAAADSPQSDVPGETVTRRVVVIDDNEDAARTMAMLIEELGSETRVAHGGEAGLKVISEFRPDVVLLDIGMPGIDGFETCRRIRVEPFGSDLLIVALTGWGQERDKRRALDAGFDAHLTKPADPAVLERILVASRRVGPYPGTIEE
jgi:PAS domain S-box-containing protein